MKNVCTRFTETFDENDKVFEVTPRYEDYCDYIIHKVRVKEGS